MPVLLVRGCYGHPRRFRPQILGSVQEQDLRAGAERGGRQLPQVAGSAVPQEGKQTVQELVREPLGQRDGGHHRIGQHPTLVVTERALVLPRKPQRDRTGPLQQPGGQTQPQGPVRPRIASRARRRRVAQDGGDMRQPVFGMLLLLLLDVLSYQPANCRIPRSTLPRHDGDQRLERAGREPDVGLRDLRI
ncbi:hypothetical protein [Streptomyces mirabilis]|uniref:hypothetical protein n=1 Tax=Streptomyces mirabilis TaxID=68239 RepID=UPI0038113D0D